MVELRPGGFSYKESVSATASQNQEAVLSLKSLILNCTLKPSPQVSNTEALARVLMQALEKRGVESEILRVLDYDVRPGVSSDEGNGDEWPKIRSKILASDILVMASPTWLGQPSSVAKRALERMDAMLSETDDQGRPIALASPEENCCLNSPIVRQREKCGIKTKVLLLQVLFAAGILTSTPVTTDCFQRKSREYCLL